MTLLRSVRHPRYLATAWPWRALAYASTSALAAGLIWLALAAPVAALAAAARVARDGGTVPLLAAAGLGLLGLGLLAVAGPRLALAMAGLERRRLRLGGSVPVPAPRPAGRYTDAVTWRAVAYALLLALIAPVWLGVLGVAFLLVATTPLAMYHRLAGGDSASNVFGRLSIGLVLIPVLLYLSAVLGGAHAALARLLLGGEPEPAAAELAEVTRSRARLADAFEAERSRIERDLHDVAQQRLVSL